jgi:predicted amidohydrolase YtcJ
MHQKIATILSVVLLFAGIGCHGGPDAAHTADAIYYGGDIVTVNDAQPQAEALAVKDGKILMVGSREQIEKSYKGATTTMIDLAGKTLTPSFIDPHSHFSDSLSMADRVNVSAPPVGPAASPAEIVAELQKYGKSKEAGELIIGYGYDENLMPKGQHLTRAQLDKAFPNNPF